MFKLKNKKKKSAPNDLSKIVSISNPKSFVTEQYRTIRTNIQYAAKNKGVQTLVVTSSTSGEGKTTSATNLAVVFALSGVKVLLVDADLRTRSLSKMFDRVGFYGLSTALGNEDLDYEEYTEQLWIDNLYFLPSGAPPYNPSEMLSSVLMENLLENMKENFDMIIFDMPPVIPVTDAQIIAAKADGTILVVREGFSNKKLILRTKQELETVRANLLGVVYNCARSDSNNNYYYYSDNQK